jgi:5-methylcytosine-specific restriction endonuclease McrA
MKKHVKNYLKHFSIGEQDVWFCEACGRQFRIDNGLDIHHIIFRSQGGSDDVENCACLCRKCHTRAHTDLPKSDMQYIHNSFMSGNKKQYLK